MKKVILVGYMAVGKTTIAQLLSEKTGVKYVDLDNLIEEKTNLTISELFKQKGEIYFRRIEHEIFKEITENGENLIISTGGGTPCYADNHLLLNGKNNISIYLNASLPVILERLISEKKTRPLVASQSEEELKEFVSKHLFERSYFYNQATFKVNIDNKTPDSIVQEILQFLD
ncbi:shikimate kinase [Flavobacterium sangjuense]|uniref:Shikimate kinase n=1 Tax=Flavobacterium sangjuense TaxID=2518177 RepID=A0A4P7PVH4_9FLAO|nr:shikimate kinase [Flavobacterium sangjuense]QBZ99011.1 Shikimate kinase [Flavobacterium sangjuense]